MNDVQFEEQDYRTQQRMVTTKNRSALVRFIVEKGIVKTEKAANALIICFTIFIFLIAFLVLFLGSTQAREQNENYLKVTETYDHSKIVLQEKVQE